MVAILDFLENSKTAQNQLEIKLSISMGKRERKMQFKKFYVKIVESGFWKSGCHGNGWIGTDLINTPNKSYEKSPNFVAVAVLVAKIRIFEISAGTLCPPSPLLCKIGLIAMILSMYSIAFSVLQQGDNLEMA